MSYTCCVEENIMITRQVCLVEKTCRLFLLFNAFVRICLIWIEFYLECVKKFWDASGGKNVISY